MKETDYDLLVLIKENNDEKAKIRLWEKYVPKINSTYYRYRGFLNSLGIYEDDFKQDSYFAFENTIEYISLEKMKKSNSSFGTSFYWFLLKTKNKYADDKETNRQTVYLSDLFKSQEMDSRSYSISSEFEDKSATVFDDEIQKREIFNLVQKFINEQDDGDKELLQGYLEGKTFRELSKNSGLPYSTVRNYINGAKDTLTSMHQQSLV